MIDIRNLDIKAPDKAKIAELTEFCHCSNLLAHLLINRGIDSPDKAERYFRADWQDVCDPYLYPGIPEAVELITVALSKGQRIFVCGDYDVDGVSATAILVLGLRQLQAQVDCHVPHRFIEGFGLSRIGVEAALKYKASLLITVDCGSSDAETVAYAQSEGLKVIVTDHHEIEGTPAKPDAFVNANLPGHNYPFTKLCGAAVAWKLLCALFKRFSLPEPREFLDLTALATLCDMVPMHGENRTLVMLGLPALVNLERPALKILAQSCKISPESINAQSLSFSIGPKLNACGRMDTPQWALDLLLCQNTEVCQMKAARLLELSEERHRTELQTMKEIDLILNERASQKFNCIFVCGHWHKGVVGLCAQRLMDIYRVPVLVATDIDRNSGIVGSGRAPQGLNLLDILKLCASHLQQYGGHANAGGFTIMEGHEHLLEAALEDACRQLKIVAPAKPVDCILPVHKLNMNLLRELERLEPTGNKNEKPLFLARGVKVVTPLRPMGKFRSSVSFQVIDDDFPNGRPPLKAVAFNKIKDLAFLDTENGTISFLYNLEENTWAGRSELQIIIKDFIAPDPRAVQVLPASEEQLAVFGAYSEARQTLEAIGSGRLKFLEGVFAHSELPKQLVDVRYVTNKELYLKRLLSQANGFVLVVAESSSQVRQWQANFKDSRVKFVLAGEVYNDLPSHGDGDEADSNIYEHIVLLAPPINRHFFAIDAVTKGQFIHVLFGREQLEAQFRGLRAYALNRDIMKDIYKWVARACCQGERLWQGREGDLKQAARSLKLEFLTFRRAMKVLVELGVVETRNEAANGCSSLIFHKAAEGCRLDLEQSALYRSASHLLEEFDKVKLDFSQLILR